MASERRSYDFYFEFGFGSGKGSVEGFTSATVDSQWLTAQGASGDPSVQCVWKEEILMTGSTFQTRVAAPDEMPQAVACIVSAFITDPLARFLWPSPHDYLQAMSSLTREYAVGSFKHGSAFVCADFGGAALWLPPGISPAAEALERLFQETVDPERLDDVRVGFEKMDEVRPNEPHWYLPFIGVDPNAQNRGIGNALMTNGASLCDRERLSAYLESTNPRNVSLYKRHGFEVVGEIRVGEALVITPMLRRPR